MPFFQRRRGEGRARRGADDAMRCAAAAVAVTSQALHRPSLFPYPSSSLFPVLLCHTFTHRSEHIKSPPRPLPSLLLSPSLFLTLSPPNSVILSVNSVTPSPTPSHSALPCLSSPVTPPLSPLPCPLSLPPLPHYSYACLTSPDSTSCTHPKPSTSPDATYPIYTIPLRHGCQ